MFWPQRSLKQLQSGFLRFDCFIQIAIRTQSQHQVIGENREFFCWHLHTPRYSHCLARFFNRRLILASVSIQHGLCIQQLHVQHVFLTQLRSNLGQVLRQQPLRVVHPPPLSQESDQFRRRLKR